MEYYWGFLLEIVNVLSVDGWLVIGDVGWMDEVGRFWFFGCFKDVIKSGGENVYVFEVVIVNVFIVVNGDVWCYFNVMFGSIDNIVMIVVFIIM